MTIRFARMALLAVTIVLGVSAHLMARVPTSRITIEGGHLVAPIELVDRAITSQFLVWDGRGTYSSSPQTGMVADTEGFMINWSAGIVADRPAGLLRYKVNFYGLSHERGNATRPAGVEFLAYTVWYEYDPSTGRGFVYLPGKNDPEWTNNVFSINRGGIEGNWFQPTAAWQQVVAPLVTDAFRGVPR